MLHVCGNLHVTCQFRARPAPCRTSLLSTSYVLPRRIYRLTLYLANDSIPLLWHHDSLQTRSLVRRLGCLQNRGLRQELGSLPDHSLPQEHPPQQLLSRLLIKKPNSPSSDRGVCGRGGDMPLEDRLQLQQHPLELCPPNDMT